MITYAASRSSRGVLKSRVFMDDTSSDLLLKMLKSDLASPSILLVADS